LLFHLFIYFVVVLFGWSFMPKFEGWSALDVLDLILYFMPSVHHSLVFHARKISLAVGAAH